MKRPTAIVGAASAIGIRPYDGFWIHLDADGKCDERLADLLVRLSN